jgi:hypothetical protein
VTDTREKGQVPDGSQTGKRRETRGALAQGSSLAGSSLCILTRGCFCRVRTPGNHWLPPRSSLCTLRATSPEHAHHLFLFYTPLSQTPGTRACLLSPRPPPSKPILAVFFRLPPICIPYPARHCFFFLLLLS